jgi:hypothetical protein
MKGLFYEALKYKNADSLRLSGDQIQMWSQGSRSPSDAGGIVCVSRFSKENGFAWPCKSVTLRRFTV